GHWLIVGWGRFTQRRWAREPRVVEGMILRALAVSFVADVATQPAIVMMTGIVSPAAVPANLAVGWAVAPLMVLALAACLVGSAALLLGIPAGLAAWLLVPAAPAAWWIHAVAERCSRTWVLHTPGGPGWALAWAAMLGTMILAAMGVLWWQTIPALFACAMLLVRIGTWQLGPYEAAAPAPGWGSDLGAEPHWTVAVCGRDGETSGWELRYPTGTRQPCQTPRGKLTLQAGGVVEKEGEQAAAGEPKVVTVSSDAQALSVWEAALIVVLDCAGPAEGKGRRSHGRPSQTPGGVPVHYPCADGAGLLTPKGLVVSGGPR
ncbi:MAG TPA: ComEC/Rec2 family competence protein, partial [Corynebacterium sp.]